MVWNPRCRAEIPPLYRAGWKAFPRDQAVSPVADLRRAMALATCQGQGSPGVRREAGRRSSGLFWGLGLNGCVAYELPPTTRRP
jgi:hypothetical protein